MWTATALVLALTQAENPSPLAPLSAAERGVGGRGLPQRIAQTGELKVENVRATHGFLGPTREGFTVLPGDFLYIAFDIAGLKPDKDNSLSFSSTMQIFDSAGKTVQPLKQLGQVAYVNLLAGTRTQHTVLIAVPVDFKAGKYDMKINIEDTNGKNKATLNRQFEVAAPALGVVQFQISQDIGNLIRLPAVAVVGQPVFVNAAVVGHKADGKTPTAIKAEMVMLDEQNKPLSAPIGREFQVPPETPVWHVQFDLPVTRAGRFKIQLKATDVKEKKTATLTVPFLAVDQK